MGSDEVKDLELVIESSHHIASEKLESVYSWDSDSDGKTEIFDNRISVD